MTKFFQSLSARIPHFILSHKNNSYLKKSRSFCNTAHFQTLVVATCIDALTCFSVLVMVLLKSIRACKNQVAARMTPHNAYIELLATEVVLLTVQSFPTLTTIWYALTMHLKLTEDILLVTELLNPLIQLNGLLTYFWTVHLKNFELSDVWKTESSVKKWAQGRQ